MRFTRFLHGPAGTALRYAVSLAVLGWLAGRVEWHRFGELLAVDWRLLLPAVLLAGLAYPLQAWRWQWLLQAQGIALPARWVHGVFWIGQFYNSFLPGGVAGDAVRFAYLWKIVPERKAAGAASLLADRLLGLVSLCALAALALGAHLSQAGANAELTILLVASGAALALLLGFAWVFAGTAAWVPLAARVIGADRASALQAAAASLGAAPATLARCTGLSVAIWLLDFASLWLLARGIGLPCGVLEMSVAAAAAYVAASLPISIGGHGVREGTLVAVLALVGIGAGEPGAVALLALAFWTLTVGWSVVGGGVYLVSLLTGWPVPSGPRRTSAR